MPATKTPFHSEKTEVVYGFEKTTEAIMKFLNNAEVSMNICADYNSPSVAIGVEVFRKGLYELKTRNVKSRFITDITKDNIKYCKELMQITELRHLDEIKGNFALSEKEYTASATLQEASLIQQVTYSNVRAILDQQHYVFETLWTRAIPADQKIRGIEEGIDLGRTDIIQSPKMILDLLTNMIKSAKTEILLLFPTINAFLPEERIEVIKLLEKSAIEKNVSVRILTPSNDVVEEILQDTEAASARKDSHEKQKGQRFEERRGNIQFKEIAVTTITILVVDRKESLAIEKTDDSKLDSTEAIGLTTYSNSEPTVISYVSIFEGLWKQAELVDRLKTHDKMQREFINIASHEMKTPTQAILGTSGLLKIYPEKRDELVEILQRNAKRLQTLISNILDVTRIESQTLVLNKERFDMCNLVSSVLEDYKDRAKDSNSNIQLINKNNNNNNPIFVEADKDRIVQVLSNLLSNAIKFTNQGEISINLFEKIQNNEDRKKEVFVSVTDTGIGINSEIFGRLFSKFASRPYQGAGLGLFICKSIVEAHGGKIWAENNFDGKGATISFSLPIIQIK